MDTRARMMAEAEAEREAETTLLECAGQPERPKPNKRRSRRLQWRAGVVAALACSAALAGLGAGALLFAGDGERTVAMQSQIQQASAELEVGDDGATLVANGLPPEPAGETYMVWLKRPGLDAPEPTSVLFTPRSDGSGRSVPAHWTTSRACSSTPSRSAARRRRPQHPSSSPRSPEIAFSPGYQLDRDLEAIVDIARGHLAPEPRDGPGPPRARGSLAGLFARWLVDGIGRPASWFKTGAASRSQPAMAQSMIAFIVSSVAPSRAWIDRPSSTVL